ncbi:MAG: formate dehydrogenase accessory sulfurtransferase FdhD [Gordonibacter sp.]|nr:formate dehydrogenase accessory sulfurtransferase FdhD [Gordonibacter sp.]
MGGDGYRVMCEAWYVEGDKWSLVTEAVAREESVGIFLDGILVEEISCTPEDLGDLAVGYLFTSGVIGGPDVVLPVEAVGGSGGWEVQVVSSQLLMPREPWLRRVETPLGSTGMFKVSPDAVHRASAALLDAQLMHRGTGATHAAAFADFAGCYRYIREDIGRHNAVDKLIGSLLRDQIDPLSGFVHLSSRCALDLVRKCAAYGIRLVSTVSAPTSAVLEYADEQGITLCAFARSGHFTVYTHPENLSS